MDGTLVNSEPLHFAITKQILLEDGFDLSPDLQHAMTGRSLDACHHILVERVGLRLSLNEFATRKHRLYLQQTNSLRARPGAKAAFEIAAAYGTLQAVVTNSDRHLVNASLTAIGLEPAALISVSRDDVRQGKPSPEPYRLAARLLSANPADCIVIEDSPTGAQAGFAARMTVIAWPEPGFSRSAFCPEVLFVEDDGSGLGLSELLKILL